MVMAVWYIRERFRMNSGSCSLGLEEIGRTRCNLTVVLENL
jgi:hypothetical protein